MVFLKLLVALTYFALARAGNDGGGNTDWNCWPSTTTIWSVATSYQTVVSTSLAYITETTTSVATVQVTNTVTTTQIQVQPTTIVQTTTVVQPTTIVQTTTVVQPTTIVQTTTVVQPTTVVNVNTVTQISSSIVNVPVPTTVINTVVNPTTIVSQQTITSVDLSTVTSTATTTVSTCPPTLTGLVTCTSRIVNPTYTPPAPLPSNYHWGCPPGTICTPPQIDCNWEQNPPNDTYVCHPSECKPLPPVTHPEDFNATWPNPTESDCAWYEPVPGYFNLNPQHFGLDFAIFDVYGQPVCPPATTTTSSSTKTGWLDWNTAAPKPSVSHTPRMPRRRSGNPLAELVHKRQSLGSAPSQCFSVYNGAQLIAQRVGHVYDQLCPSSTDFMVAVGGCRTCAAANGGTSSETDSFPDLAAYFNWCQTNAPS